MKEHKLSREQQNPCISLSSGRNEKYSQSKHVTEHDENSVSV